MKIKEVLSCLEQRFPLSWQEDFDNCGIQCGDKEREITGALICFELSDSVIDEAIRTGANLVISHHPLIFKGVKKIEPTNRVGRIICKAIENKILVYSMHTNVDSGIGGGNDLFAEKLQLKNVSVLAPAEGMYRKLVFFVPAMNADNVCQALYKVGCGKIGNYDRCSYNVHGEGTFRPLEGSNPYIGQMNKVESVEELRVEMIFPASIQRKVISTLYAEHPYEEPAFDIFKIENVSRQVGLGRVGELPEPMMPEQFFEYLKHQLHIEHLRYSGDMNKMIKKVAVCGGAGGSFIGQAMASGADAYVTGDIRYHDFFTPDNQMVIADIGHFEGEHFIKEIIYNELNKNFSNFAISKIKDEVSEVNVI